MLDTVSQVSRSVKGLEREFSIIAHNLANVSTVGFKRSFNLFSEPAKSGQSDDSRHNPLSKPVVDFSQGSFVQTGRSLDFAIYGNGFFVVETPDGPLYTRNGMFYTNENGQIVDSKGRTIAGMNGPINIPNNIDLNELHISDDGTIAAGAANLGKFRIVDFREQEESLVPVGASCFLNPDKQLDPDIATGIEIKQGYQESSNVQMVQELVDMLMVSRLYEANMKFMTAKKEASAKLMSVAMG